MEIKDIAEYEETDSELAKYTISDLHYRIDKAIEYIEEKTIIWRGDNSAVSMLDYDKITNILKGSDKE